jgi:hypothetical protein
VGPGDGLLAPVQQQYSAAAAAKLVVEALGIQEGDEMAIDRIQYATMRVGRRFGGRHGSVSLGQGGEGGTRVLLQQATAKAPAGGLTGILLGATDFEATAAERAAGGASFPQRSAKLEWGGAMALLSGTDGSVLVLHDAS